MQMLRFVQLTGLFILFMLLPSSASAESEFFQKGLVYEQEQHWTEAFSKTHSGSSPIWRKPSKPLKDIICAKA